MEVVELWKREDKTIVSVGAKCLEWQAGQRDETGERYQKSDHENHPHGMVMVLKSKLPKQNNTLPVFPTQTPRIDERLKQNIVFLDNETGKYAEP